MTDNRTTELRKLLTERGIEYETNDHMGVCETSWNGFTVMQLTPSAKLIMTVTPEQAIATTLGSDTKPCYATDYTHEHCKYSVNRGWVENVAHGTLTAEQVEKAIHDCSTYASYDGCTYYASGIRLQAIADELNARAERTCVKFPSLTEQTCIVRRKGFEAEFGYWRCSECNCENFEGARYCMGCGAKVVGE